MIRLGQGIFAWDRDERITNRYGAFYVGDRNYLGTVTNRAEMYATPALSMNGQRVKLMCRVLESRKSDHAGDLFLQIKPSQPRVGEEIVLGVGIFETAMGHDGTRWSLQPGDGRSELWIDPYKLYRLHDQTVEVYADITEEDFSPVPEVKKSESGVLSNGDGSFQTKHVVLKDGDRIKPKSRRLGDGLFELSYDFKEGEPIEVLPD